MKKDLFINRSIACLFVLINVVCLARTEMAVEMPSVEEKLLPNLPESELKELPAKILNYEKDFGKNTVLRKDALRELIVVQGRNDAPNVHLLKAVNRTKTVYGFEALKVLLSNPLSAKEEKELLKRQTLVKRLANSPEFLSDVDQALTNIANNQENVFLLWSLANPFNNASDLQSLFIQLTGTGNSKLGMECVRQGLKASMYGTSIIFGTFASFVTYDFLKHWFKGKNTKRYLPWLLGVGIVNGIWFTKLFPKLNQSEKANLELQELMISVGQTLQGAKDLATAISRVDGAFETLKYGRDLVAYTKVANELNKKLKKLLKELQANTFKGKPDWKSYMGRVRIAYKYVTELKDSLIPLFKAIGEIDAFVSPAKLVVEYKDKPVHYCFTDFVKSEDHPILSVVNSWNPVINQEGIVTESISLGYAEGLVPNLLLTGPHGGGKSTFMRQLAYAVILSQVYGISAAEKCSMTIFSTINTYLDIKENPEKGMSAFMAERERMRKLKFNIRGLNENRFGFTIIDEPFKATMENEASKLVTTFMERIEHVSENICLMATHFIEPAIAAEQRENSKFVNYHMETVERTPGRFRRFFKLQQGKCSWWFGNQEMRSRYVNWLQSV